MKIALAQINPTVGDISGNVRKIEEWTARAAAQKANLVVFPELCITGYPPRDLVEHPRFIERNLEAVQELAERLKGPAVIVGFVDHNVERVGKRLYNAVALLTNGKVLAVRHKSLLPTYDVFDEMRNFASSRENDPIPFTHHQLGLTICEDMWNAPGIGETRLYPNDPVGRLAAAGADILINISSSPFHHRKTQTRLDLVRRHVRQCRRPFLFVNQVGGNDELIFDGNSFAVDATGRLIAQAKAFEEDLLIVDSEAAGTSMEWRESGDVEEIRDALTLGLRDYMRKCGFTHALLGLSGGIDSAVTAALAVRALGPKNVLGVLMPSQFSSKGSVTDAAALAKNLGIETLKIPITPPFEAFKRSLKKAFGKKKPDVTEENLQARIRGTMLMAISNKYGALLLSTGNKSELSMGYCTLYGDMNGGLAVISDVLKTTVYELGRVLNKPKAVIPEASFTKPPSAELRPNQTDQDSLPEYEILDAIVEAYIEQGKDVDEIAEMGYDRKLVEKVLSTIDRNEYKRRQAAPGLRITTKAFGIGRRMPIARGDFRS